MRFKYKNNVGNHYYNRRKLKPGDIIDTDSVGGAIDKFEQLDPDPEPVLPNVGLHAKETEDGRFDVVNETTGEPINDAPLNKNEVDQLVDKDVSKKFVMVKIINDKFNVMNNATGKPINKEPLSKKEAKKLLRNNDATSA